MSNNLLSKYPAYAKFAKDMKSKGESYRTIADALLKKGLKISHMGVKNYIDNADVLGAQAIQQDQALRQQVKQDVLDTSSQMKKINTKLWEIMDELEGAKDKDYRLILHALDKILKQMDISAKTLARITQPTHVTQNISYLDFSLRVNTYIEKLAKAGYIEVKKPLDLGIINQTTTSDVDYSQSDSP